MKPEIILLVRMLSAVACGAAIGFERSRRAKEAGIRTHIMVTLGAALMVIVSKYGFLDIVGVPGVNVDVARLAANVITGISFLGAGVIFLKSGSIRGLTTAAGIWTTAGVGCALGAGMYLTGISATLMILAIHIFLHLFKPASENVTVAELTMKLANGKNVISDVRSWFEKNGIAVLNMGISGGEDKLITVEMTVRIPRNITAEKVFCEINENPDILGFSAQM